jgi:putative transposase
LIDALDNGLLSDVDGKVGGIVVTRVDPAMRAMLVARLRIRRAEGGLTSGEVRGAGVALGVSERTVWRWLSSENAVTGGKPRPRYELSQADRDGYAQWNGNIAAMRRARLAAGETVPGLRTLQRAFARELSPGERAAVVEGAEGWRRHQVYLRWEASARNARWEADHKELPVLVTPPRGIRACKPWATLFLDCYSRLIMGWALSLHPNSATVLAALRRGLVVDPARGPFGGVPTALVPDNGLEFATAALERVCATLGIELEPTDSYAPHQKGKLERANLTLDQEFLCGLPFYTDGPRAVNGRLFGPDVPPMGLALFAELFDDWVIEYNTQRAHSALDGQTPLQRWMTDATPIRQVPEDQLRWLLLADATRTINKDGIHFGGLVFIAGELNGLVGEQVQVRYTPHDLRQIEVFRGDEWLCTALPQGQLSEEERAAVLARRREDAAELGRRQRRASRRARARLAPITGPGEVEDTTTISAGQARDERRGGGAGRWRDDDLRRLAMTNLLGLKTDFAYWNPELAEQPTPATPTAPLEEITSPPPLENGAS